MLRINTAKFLFPASIFLIIIEVGLRYSERLNTYTEKNFGNYQSIYNSKNTSHLFVLCKEDTINIVETEFNYSYATNSYGLIYKSNIDSSKLNTSIVFLGDSFVFGIGAPQDSSLPVLLSSKTNLNVINAGIPGSDPFFQNALIDSIFKPKGFHKLLFMVNPSDIYDYVIRGGKERFLENNTVSYRQAPWFEPIYQYSFIFRAIIHVVLQADYSLLPKKELKKFKEEAIIQYTLLFEKIAADNNILIILQPYARQYAENDKILTEVLNYEYINRLEEMLKIKGIKTINLNSQLKNYITSENYLEYAWDLDGHYKSKGYELISRILAAELNGSGFMKITRDY